MGTLNQFNSNISSSQADSSDRSLKMIPVPHEGPFVDGIDHPELYLWDAWSFLQDEELHLYCLAISRTDSVGEMISPDSRNLRRFHIRHFVSHDMGVTWLDQGSFQEPREGQRLFDSRTIWSGSIIALDATRQLCAFTGIREQNEDLLFQQSLGLAFSNDWEHVVEDSQHVISDPLNDWDAIVDQGYFLGDIELLGHKNGEAGGPILAWRDPFLFAHHDQVHVFWSAKIAHDEPALGHALLSDTGAGYKISKLYHPVTMPDSEHYTQLELPKILHDEAHDKYYLLVASCNRIHEQQSDAEADKRTRLYRSDSLEGPWLEHGHEGSTLNLDEPNMFGITVLSADFRAQTIDYIAPYTEEAGVEKFLTLSKTYKLSLSELGSNPACVK